MNPQPPMSPQGMAAAPQARQMPPQARMGQPSPQAMMAARGGMLTILTMKVTTLKAVLLDLAREFL